jgi:hypothetical protein
MRLEGKHIAAFQSLYKQRFGVEISDEDAREQGTKLLRLVQLIYKPMTHDELGRVRERQAELI